MHRLCVSHLASTTEESSSGRTRSPSAERPVATRTVGSSSTTPPWREREQRQRTARGRERSQTPVERNTRTRTETRSSTGASWTNPGCDRDRPVGVPEPPPPPTRMSGSQWLNQGYQEPQSSSSSYRSHGSAGQAGAEVSKELVYCSKESTHRKSDTGRDEQMKTTSGSAGSRITVKANDT